MSSLVEQTGRDACASPRFWAPGHGPTMTIGSSSDAMILLTLPALPRAARFRGRAWHSLLPGTAPGGTGPTHGPAALARCCTCQALASRLPRAAHLHPVLSTPGTGLSGPAGATIAPGGSGSGSRVTLHRSGHMFSLPTASRLPASRELWPARRSAQPSAVPAARRFPRT